MKNTTESTEFFIPKELSVDYYLNSESKQVSAIHHLARYEWACTVIGHAARLLDVACGSGYGSYMMALNNPNLEVIGVDYDPRAIEIAQNRFSAPNLQYRNGDMVRWVYNDYTSMGAFDAIVSFDTIEHLNHREIALINFAENLSPSGSLLISTPSGHKHTLLNPPWEHHKVEYSGSYLYNLMRHFFNEVYFPDNGTLPNISFWLELNKRSPNIYYNRMNPLFCKSPLKFGLTT
jgi:2-polyprenyl-3-methyl-5-hydroxy-6-metoxy-1,4-benzoquinol methylase